MKLSVSDYWWCSRHHKNNRLCSLYNQTNVSPHHRASSNRTRRVDLALLGVAAQLRLVSYFEQALYRVDPKLDKKHNLVLHKRQGVNTVKTRLLWCRNRIVYNQRPYVLGQVEVWEHQSNYMLTLWKSLPMRILSYLHALKSILIGTRHDGRWYHEAYERGSKPSNAWRFHIVFPSVGINSAHLVIPQGVRYGQGLSGVDCCIRSIGNSPSGIMSKIEEWGSTIRLDTRVVRVGPYWPNPRGNGQAR